MVTVATEAEFTYYINAYAGRPCGSSYLAAGGTCSSKSTKCQLTDPRTAVTAVLQVCDDVWWLLYGSASMARPACTQMMSTERALPACIQPCIGSCVTN